MGGVGGKRGISIFFVCYFPILSCGGWHSDMVVSTAFLGGNCMFSLCLDGL